VCGSGGGRRRREALVERRKLETRSRKVEVRKWKLESESGWSDVRLNQGDAFTDEDGNRDGNYKDFVAHLRCSRFRFYGKSPTLRYTQTAGAVRAPKVSPAREGWVKDRATIEKHRRCATKSYSSRLCFHPHREASP